MRQTKPLMIRIPLLAVALGWALLGASQAGALPGLQLDLDAANVSYDSSTQTIVTTDDTFKVYAYLTPKDGVDVNALLADTYYLSIALTPKTGPTHGTLGSFEVDGSSVSVTGDMTYGTPPGGDSNQLFDEGDLPKHGIFNTFFYEVGFQFDPTATTTPYDTQDVRFADGFDASGSGMYYVAFDIDKSLLNSGLQLHFDLYNTAAKNGDIDLQKQPYNEYAKAPFSHDAETVIPEPTGLLLFSAGLLVVGHAMRRRG